MGMGMGVYARSTYPATSIYVAALLPLWDELNNGLWRWQWPLARPPDTNAFPN